ncbi:MAG TPA: DUF885 domain-containing protein [Terriglobales bacterium]|jgi:uncharacterized protein (DUF885 family)|nr:DUF885 domain-containing protein [Terriglobales bacterium]
MRFLICLLAVAMLIPFAVAVANPPADLEARRKALNDLLHEQWEYTMRTSPIYASILGDKRYNDKLDDFSQAAIDDNLEQTRRFLVRFEAIDTTGFPEQEALNRQLMVRDLKMGLEGARFKPWEMPVSQESGIQIDAPQLVSILSFQNVKDYEDYITRLKLLPVLFDQTIAQMRKGLAEGRMPPKILLEKVVTQANGLATTPPEQNPFTHPFDKFPDAVPEADRKRLREAGLAAVKDSVIPAYVKFTAFVRDEYAPKGRMEPGAWALPDGDAWYAFRVKDSTTTDLSPEEIHQLGLAQVKEVEGRMLAVVNQLGYKDMKSFKAAVDADPKLHAHSREEILDLYRKYENQMYARLPEMFGRLPKSKLEVMPVEEFREKEAADAAYMDGTPDGSRPGHIMVNTGDFAKRTVLDIETTAYHEGVPGHHMQISIAQELPELPPFRQHEEYTAYTEGWALYSERLGKEVGFYQDPYSYYGHLQDDMLRAIRLVVDTGFHYKRWTRQQVVDYFHAHSTIDEVSVQSETDRYMAWPAQALGYKVGQLEILKLRQYSKDQLGDKFDLRAFHDEVLSGGALPMDVLSTRIHEWVEQQKTQASLSPSSPQSSPASSSNQN